LSAAKILFTFALSFVNIKSSYATEGFDYSLDVGMRSLPKAASLRAEVGYGQVLWGNRTHGEVLYGYVRPVTRFRTSVLVNAAEAELQLAPISFLILSGGSSVSQRNIDSATIDCSQFDCRGVLGSQHVGTTFLLGAGAWSGGLDLRVDWMKPMSAGATTSDFADENSVLVGKRDGDRLLTQQSFLVYQPLENWRLGGFMSKQQMTTSSTSNQTQGVFTRFTAPPWSYVVGLNLYESTTQTRSPGIFIALSWSGIPSIGLL